MRGDAPTLDSATGPGPLPVATLTAGLRDGPDYGSHIIYADCQAAMIKATKAIVDTVGHYARPDVLRLLVRRNDT